MQADDDDDGESGRWWVNFYSRLSIARTIPDPSASSFEQQQLKQETTRLSPFYRSAIRYQTVR
jgi:hypothetical protein